MEKTASNTDNTEKILYTFPKEEKLCSIKDIEELFKKGSSTFLYPFRLLHLPAKQEEQTYPKVLISIPKKLFKKAVDRNDLKRKIREIYRLNKRGIFFETPMEKRPGVLAIIYIAKEKLPYKELNRKLISILLRLKNT